MDERSRRACAWIARGLALSLIAPAMGACEPAAQADTRERMAHHFEQSVRARDAIVRGELEEARSAARDLGRAPPDLELSARHFDAMRVAARRVATASDIDFAALAFADVALQCGDCHEAMGARVDAPVPAAPRGDDVAARMRLHLWAADRLWEGLVLPDDERFAAGAAAMAEAPLFPASGTAPQTTAPEVRAVGDRVRGIARRARDAQDDASRARAYGQLLGTCADCHRYVGVRGPAPPYEL